MSQHLTKWSDGTLQMVQDCTMEYVLPVMKTHMDKNRQKDALHLWQLTLVLLKTRLSSNLAMLNQLLYVPERCMRHEDTAIRLMSMQTWAGLVDVFHDSDEWLFKKPVVHLLLSPVLVCLKEELLLNIVEAGFVSWRKIVSVAVRDFNEFCKTQDDSVEVAQQNKRKWKRWFHEMILAPILVLVKVRLGKNSDGHNTVFEVEQFIDFAKQLWKIDICEVDTRRNSYSGRSESSSVTTVSGSSAGGRGAGVDNLFCKNVDKLKTLSESDAESCAHDRISSNVIGIALLLPDIFSTVQSLVTTSNELSGDRSQQRMRMLAISIWQGLCERIRSSDKYENALIKTQVTPKLRLRLLRMSIDFSFGILASSPTVSTDAATANLESKQAGQLEDKNGCTAVRAARFGFQWQLELLAPLISRVVSSRDLRVVTLHSKSKLHDHITQRMDYLKTTYSQCAEVLYQWNGADTSDVWLDFLAKSNVLPYVVMNLLFEYAVYIDGVDDDDVEKTGTLDTLEVVLKAVITSMKAGDQQLPSGVERIICFTENAVRVMHEYKSGDSDKESMLNNLCVICKNSPERSFESQQNASLLLDLHQSHKSAGIAIPAASTGNPIGDTLDIEYNCGGIIGESVSQTSIAGSPCISSGEIATKSNTIGIDSSPASPTNEPSKPSTNARQTPDPGAAEKGANTGGTPAAPFKSIASDQAKTLELRSVKPQTPTVGSMSAPPNFTDTRSGSSAARQERTNVGAVQCICPDLVGCSEGVASLYRHFPMTFRPLFSFYKVKTIGDSSALSVERVRTFGIKDPVVTVRRALEEFNGRKDRMKSLASSPFRKRNPRSPGSATMSPLIGLPSPHKAAKRTMDNGDVAPLLLEQGLRKRTRRSLALDGADDEHGQSTEESEGTRRKPKLVDRVTFCLPVSGETGETRITRPGEDSLGQLEGAAQEEERGSVQEEMDTYTIKLLQHLRRSAHYMDKLVREEESMQSEEASLQTSAMAVSGAITNYQEAHELIATLTVQLRQAAEASSVRCSKLLEKRESSGPSRPT